MKKELLDFHFFLLSFPLSCLPLTSILIWIPICLNFCFPSVFELYHQAAASMLPDLLQQGGLIVQCRIYLNFPLLYLGYRMKKRC